LISEKAFEERQLFPGRPIQAMRVCTFNFLTWFQLRELFLRNATGTKREKGTKP
jgi:hypothetical protein